MSGYTRVTRQGEFFELALTTPNMNFAMNPMTGESPEQNYHASARARFERILADKAAFIDEQMKTFRDEFAARAKFRAFDASLQRRSEGERGPCRVDFMVRMLGVNIALDAPPSRKLREEMQQRLHALFVLKAQLVTQDYEVILEADALGDDEAATTRATLEQTLNEAQPDLDAAVIALRAEQVNKLAILPYDAALPIASLSQKEGSGGPCRFELRVDVPRGAALFLTLSAAPTNQQWIDLDARLRALQIEQLRQKNARPTPSAKPGWLSRLFK